jgi:hypothetical protein
MTTAAVVTAKANLDSAEIQRQMLEAQKSERSSSSPPPVAHRSSSAPPVSPPSSPHPHPLPPTKQAAKVNNHQHVVSSKLRRRVKLDRKPSLGPTNVPTEPNQRNSRRVAPPRIHHLENERSPSPVPVDSRFSDLHLIGLGTFYTAMFSSAVFMTLKRCT